MVTVIAILTAIAVPLFIAGVEKVKRVVCDYNSSQLEKMYKAYLVLENANHTEAMFLQYLQEYGHNICAYGGNIIYQDGKIKCIVHSGSEGDDSDNGDVPFL